MDGCMKTRKKLNRLVSGTLGLSMTLLNLSGLSVFADDNPAGFGTTSEQTTTTIVSYGDPNGDGKIDAKDASFCLAEYSLLSTGASSSLSEAEKNAADVNRDEKIDSKDASDILSYYGYQSTGGTDSLADFLLVSYPEGPEEIEGDGPFCLDASYDAESNKVSINVLFSPSDSIVILESDNNEEFSEVDTLSGTKKYTFTVGENFTTKYFKATGVDENGENVETTAIVVAIDEDDILIGYIDSDEDGLTDFTESLLGTDPEKKDTDLDGLTDWEEINLTGTDPLRRDTDEDDISDSEKDPDEDGLTNIEEIRYNCNPRLKDTDEDHLNDGDEIKKYGTDPTEPDTDHDTLNDDFEIRYELDPLNDTTDGIKDAERTIEQTITSEYGQFYRVNSVDNAYSLSLGVVASGDGNKEISVVTDTCNEAYKTDAQVGKMIDITYSDTFIPDSVKLKFKIRDGYLESKDDKYSDLEEFKGIKRLNVFKLYEEIGMMLPIETEYDTKNNMITADIDEAGTYCIMDMEIWFDLFELDPEDFKTPSPEMAPMSYPLEPKRKASADNEKIKTPIDLVFIMSTRGGHPTKAEAFEIEKNVIKNVAEECFKKYEDVEIYILEYKTESADLLRSRMNLDFLSTPSAFSVGLSQLQLSTEPSANEFCETKYAFKAIDEIKFRKNTNRFFYHFKISEINNTYGEDGIALCDKKIGIYSEIRPTYLEYRDPAYAETMRQAIIKNNGLDISLYSTAETTSKIIDHISSNLNTDLTPTTYHAIFANDLSKIRLDAPLKKGSDINSDTDTLTDLEEVKTEFITYDSDGYAVLPTVKDIISNLNSPIMLSADENKGLLKHAMFAAVLGRRVLPCTSNPANGDSDLDGIKDQDDLTPWEAMNSLFILNRYDKSVTSIYPESLDYQLKKLNEFHGANDPANAHGIGSVVRAGKLFLPAMAVLADLTPYPARGINMNLSRGGKMPNAAKFLKHYTENIGSDLEFDGDEAIACTKAGRTTFDRVMNMLMAEAEKNMVDGSTLCFSTRKDTSSYNKKQSELLTADFYNSNNNKEFDWEYSIGAGTSGVIAEITRNGNEYTMKFRFYIMDLYDWDKKGEPALYYLNTDGYARCFRSMGLYEDSFTWKYGERFYEFKDNSLQSYYEKEQQFQNMYIKLPHLENQYAGDITMNSKDYKAYVVVEK